MKALLLYARHYDFIGKDGAQVEGSEVYFIPQGAAVAHEAEERGIAPMKVQTTDAAAAVILREALPAVFELETGMQASRGRHKAAEVIVMAAKYLAAFPPESFILEAPQPPKAFKA